MHNFRILVPVSFSPQSDAALKQARLLAGQINTMITCLHVIEKTGKMTGKPVRREAERKFRRETEVLLSSRVHQIMDDNKDASFELIVTEGKAHRKILEKAAELNVRMIVMGRSDSEDPARRRLGSSAKKVVAASPVPVLTLQTYRTTPCRHITLPLDLTDRVTTKIVKSLELAELLDAQVTVYTIVDRYDAVLKHKSEERLQLINDLFADYEICCNTGYLEARGALSGEITGYAENIGADLIIVMTRGESNHTDMSLSSTAMEVIRKSDMPVISITPGVHTGPYPFKTIFGDVNIPLVRSQEDHLIHH
jgi:nucleotide-binding universal stress UspA family protein